VSTLYPGVGLGDDYWKNYYSPDVVEDIEGKISHTTIPTSGLPLAVRAYVQGGPAPTIMMTHGLLPYALMVSKHHLAFHRAGFNVVTADLPGFGASGGPRGGPTIPQLIQMWRDLKSFAQREFGDGPLFSIGTAEDSVTSYYAFANDPAITAMSLHVLLEYGDVENLNWQGSRPKIRAMMLGARAARALKLDLTWDAETALPWDDIIDPHVETYKNDPLVISHFTVGLAATMAKRMRAPVPFEECRTPCQMIVSEKSRLWPVEHNRRAYERLGCPRKEWVLLEGAPQWSMQDDYMHTFTENVIRWFSENGAFETSRIGTPETAEVDA
jgi:alpha-beta hydrolase superfamily lysophospholipase